MVVEKGEGTESVLVPSFDRERAREQHTLTKNSKLVARAPIAYSNSPGSVMDTAD